MKPQPEDIIDIPSDDENEPVNTSSGQELKCDGYHLVIPGGTSPYLSYPFALHHRMNLPWECAISNGWLMLCLKTCGGAIEFGRDASACHWCCLLA
jgi:hypothetical protein